MRADMAEGNLRRRLAAILAADAAGYSRLLGQDERATVAALDDARRLFRTAIESKQGRVIDMAGDSILAVFETAAGAVETALTTRQCMQAENSRLPEDRRLHFRIGVHLGDVTEKPDGTIYGNGVNIAARLQALADTSPRKWTDQKRQRSSVSRRTRSPLPAAKQTDFIHRHPHLYGHVSQLLPVKVVALEDPGSAMEAPLPSFGLLL